MTNSAFTNNQAVGTATLRGGGDGGAINTDSSTATITNSTFDGNLALGRTVNGGAISIEGPLTAADLYNGNTTISNCSFTGNQAIGGNGANNFTFEFGGQSLGGAIFTNLRRSRRSPTAHLPATWPRGATKAITTVASPTMA